MNVAGIRTEEKILLPSRCEAKKCKLKCHEKVLEHDRSRIHEHYWKELVSYDMKQAFLAEHVICTPTQRKTVGEQSRRRQTATYFFTVGRQKIRVCRDFFTTTLSETADRIRYHRQNKRRDHGGTHQDMRGRHNTHMCKIVSEENKDYIRQHIHSYPAAESHYCRSRTQRKYLPEGLSVSEMYRQYVAKCREDNLEPQKQHLYRSIFCADFNFGFHHPKKDACSQYKNDPEHDTYKTHVLRKCQARSMKNADKQHSIDNPDHCVATFDLEKVLSCPSGKVGIIFYKRKLATYNFSF